MVEFVWKITITQYAFLVKSSERNNNNNNADNQFLI